MVTDCHFNPHEREARDRWKKTRAAYIRHFNPHEREARDTFHGTRSGYSTYFNPHEREARDRVWVAPVALFRGILIHTSVKLVTTNSPLAIFHAEILIHTSVKLVTPRSLFLRKRSLKF